MKVTIVSNNNEERVKAFSDPLGIPFIHKARNHLRSAFKRAVKNMGSHAEETVIIGDQLLTDVLGGNRSGILYDSCRPSGTVRWFFYAF